MLPAPGFQISQRLSHVVRRGYTHRQICAVSHGRICACARPRKQHMSQSELQSLYTITEESCIDTAVRVAARAADTLPKYLAQCPVSEHTARAFEQVMRWRERPDARRALCIDAGCGTGTSSLRLAKMLEWCDVIGIDRSPVRLARNAFYRNGAGGVENAMLIRADLVDFWRLCYENGVSVERQYFLYPNPYPGRKNLKRRWHGHAIFPVIVALGGELEVRASWAAYLEEFGMAYAATHERLKRKESLAHIGAVTQLKDIRIDATEMHNRPLSNFEAKYIEAEQAIYRLRIKSQAIQHS